MELAEKHRRKEKELLIEGCKEMAEDSIRIIKEWEMTDQYIEWDWNNS